MLALVRPAAAEEDAEDDLAPAADDVAPSADAAGIDDDNEDEIVAEDGGDAKPELTAEEREAQVQMQALYVKYLTSRA